MASSCVTTAVFFIVLLAGHEVARGSRLYRQRVTHRTGSFWTGPEAVSIWEKENDACRRKLHFWCADGQKHPSDKSVSQCAKQSLVGQCQITDDWMLQGTSDKPVTWWLRLQAHVLGQKVEEFKMACDGVAVGSGQCRHQVGSILRAVKFISKASIGTDIQPSKMSWFSPEEQQELKNSVVEAQENLASIAFPEGSAGVKQSLLKRLVAAVSAQNQPAQNTTGTAMQLLQVVQNLMSDDEHISVAEAKIERIEKEGLDIATATDVSHGYTAGSESVGGTNDMSNQLDHISQEETNEIIQMFDFKADDFIDTYFQDDEVDNVGDENQEEEGRSLVEESSGRQLARRQLVVVARVLLVILIFLVLSVAAFSVAGPVFWTILLAFVCATKESSTNQIFPCMGDLVMRPIRWLYKETTQLIGS